MGNVLHRGDSPCVWQYVLRCQPADANLHVFEVEILYQEVEN